MPRRHIPSLALALLAAVALLCAAEIAAEMVCAGCGKPITSGTWVEAEGKTYHEEHFRCARCGNPISVAGYYVIDGRVYDSACYTAVHAPRCTYCREPIVGEWITNESGQYHRSCYYDHVAPRCISCGKPISGEYFFDDFGQTVCPACKENIRKCHACGRMLGDTPGQSYRLPDGRRICASCNRTSIGDLKLAEALMADVRHDLAELGIVVKGDVELGLVTQTELAGYSDEFHEDRLGVTVYEHAGLLGGLISLTDYRIYVLSGLPRDLLRAVLAHELMHVWLFKNGPSDHDRLLSEGSCEYAAYLVLNRIYSEDARLHINRMRESRDPVYGEGFRKVSDLVERVGKDGWLNWLRKNSAAPW